MASKSILSSTVLASLFLTGCVAIIDADSDNNRSYRSASVEEAPTTLALEDFSASRMRADVEFLADDLLKGRDTGSEGHLLAANYVASTYKRLGVEPMGEDGTYFQTVPFATGVIDQEESSVTLMVDGADVPVSLGADYILFGDVKAPVAEASGDLVFAGYGVHAPEEGYSDLEDLDLDGKIAVIMFGAPDGIGSEVKAHYRSSISKAPALKARGAVGMMIIDGRFFSERMTQDRRMNFMKRGSFSWTKPQGAGELNTLAAIVSIGPAAAAKLFDGAEMSLEEVQTAAAEGNMPTFALNASATIKKVTELNDPLTSPNVVGVIRGSDPALRDEYVVLSAHLDHIGVNENRPGDDKINNGAMDNATGTATLLEVARAYKMNGIKPRRSILLVSVTAEEKGLLGAEYFAHYPTVPVEQMVGNVNLDMPILLYDFADVVAFGAQHSSLQQVTERAVAKAGITITPDPIPEQNLFVRSDHYRFVQQGIPAVFLMTGFAETEDGVVGGDVFWDFLKTQYHTPADQPDLPINYQAGAKFAFVNFLIANEIANDDDRPTWNEGNYFGNLYGNR